jgi:hypothetical protein
MHLAAQNDGEYRESERIAVLTDNSPTSTLANHLLGSCPIAQKGAAGIDTVNAVPVLHSCLNMK